MASTTFSGPVTSTGGFVGTLAGFATVPTTDVAGAPAASDYTAGTIVYVSDGAAGSPILAFSDGTDWLRSDTGTAISLV
tara:strand:- start:197 stop:433 length:237 start_codon:yes stop_codon:yes gene_type:complete